MFETVSQTSGDLCNNPASANADCTTTALGTANGFQILNSGSISGTPGSSTAQRREQFQFTISILTNNLLSNLQVQSSTTSRKLFAMPANSVAQYFVRATVYVYYAGGTRRRVDIVVPLERRSSQQGSLNTLLREHSRHKLWQVGAARVTMDRVHPAEAAVEAVLPLGLVRGSVLVLESFWLWLLHLRGVVVVVC